MLHHAGADRADGNGAWLRVGLPRPTPPEKGGAAALHAAYRGARGRLLLLVLLFLILLLPFAWDLLLFLILLPLPFAWESASESPRCLKAAPSRYRGVASTLLYYNITCDTILYYSTVSRMISSRRPRQTSRPSPHRRPGRPAGRWP